MHRESVTLWFWTCNHWARTYWFMV